MDQEPQELMSRDEQTKLVTALRVALRRCRESGTDGTLWREMLYQANLGLKPENLGEMRNLLKALAGYDPIEGDTRPKGEKQPGLARSEARKPPSMQDLKQKIYDKAKAEPAHRFWGLYVHVRKMEVLREAYKLAKENDGSPGIDGVTFEAIEAGGTETFLEGISAELTSHTYLPMRNRRKEIPKGNGKVRVLGIPSIRDRVVQGALKLILEPIFEADFQPGSFGYRPDRSQHQAVEVVAKAIASWKTRVIDLDLKAFFDNVRHHILMEKVAKRVKDRDVLHLLKMILTASGKKGVPQGGVISPLLSNIYLNEVDGMLEKAKATTRQGKYTQVEYARFADDMVILIRWHASQDWLVGAVDKRLREELAKIQVEVNEEKTKTVDLTKGESFDFLGFRWKRVLGKSGNWRPLYTPLTKRRKELTKKIGMVFKRFLSQPTHRIVKEINPKLRGWVAYFRVGSASQCFSYIRWWVEQKIRRHLMRARKRKGLGWKRWSKERIYGTLGLFDDYSLKRWIPSQKALPC